MFSLADKGTYYSHTGSSDEIWNAINSAGLRVYLWISKELRSYFIKWDTTTIAFAPNVDEYPCPPDLATMIRFRERAPGETTYRRLNPTEVTSELFAREQEESLVGPCGDDESEFVYIGPYLPMAAAQLADALKISNIRVAPMPQDIRQTEIVYTAKWLDIVNANSHNVIPSEGHQAMLNFVKAELLRANSDDLADKYETQGMQNLNEFLTFVRNRQIQQNSTQEPYLSDLD